MDEEILIPLIVIPVLFVVLPWLILHYVTKWKVASSLTAEDEAMLDDLYDLARRLDQRMHTIERIIQDENPQWNSLSSDRALPQIDRREGREPMPRSIPADRTASPELTKRGRA